jgi:hypothetical protein
MSKPTFGCISLAFAHLILFFGGQASVFFELQDRLAQIISWPPPALANLILSSVAY